MFLFVFYAGCGVLLLLMAMGLFYRSFLMRLPEHNRMSVRVALFFFGLGLILTANYQAYVYYIVKPEIDAQKIQREVQDNVP